MSSVVVTHLKKVCQSCKLLFVLYSSTTSGFGGGGGGGGGGVSPCLLSLGMRLSQNMLENQLSTSTIASI